MGGKRAGRSGVAVPEVEHGGFDNTIWQTTAVSSIIRRSTSV